MGKSTPHYQRLVAVFATAAFVLLGMLSFQLHTTNTVAAETVRDANVMTNYRASKNCIAVKGKRSTYSNYRLCKVRP